MAVAARCSDMHVPCPLQLLGQDTAGCGTSSQKRNARAHASTNARHARTHTRTDSLKQSGTLSGRRRLFPSSQRGHSRFSHASPVKGPLQEHWPVTRLQEPYKDKHIHTQIRRMATCEQNTHAANQFRQAFNNNNARPGPLRVPHHVRTFNLLRVKTVRREADPRPRGAQRARAQRTIRPRKPRAAGARLPVVLRACTVTAAVTQ